MKKRRVFGIQTKSGETFDPNTGKVTKILLEDVAHSLSNICRYAGHCRSFYSVAEHSVLVSRIVAALWPDDPEAIRAGLLHDVTEAYVTDMPTPIKILIPEYNEMEAKLERQVIKHFGLKTSNELWRRVKIADVTALATEAQALFDNFDASDYLQTLTPMPDLLHLDFPLQPGRAKKLFLREYEKLEKLRRGS